MLPSLPEQVSAPSCSPACGFWCAGAACLACMLAEGLVDLVRRCVLLYWSQTRGPPCTRGSWSWLWLLLQTEAASSQATWMAGSTGRLGFFACLGACCSCTAHHHHSLLTAPACKELVQQTRVLLLRDVRKSGPNLALITSWAADRACCVCRNSLSRCQIRPAGSLTQMMQLWPCTICHDVPCTVGLLRAGVSQGISRRRRLCQGLTSTGARTASHTSTRSGSFPSTAAGCWPRHAGGHAPQHILPALSHAV